MKYPHLEIDLKKVNKNTEIIVEKCAEHNIDVFAVTKSYCADKRIVEASLSGGIYGIADSRIENLEKLREIKCPKLLLRIPMLSEIKDVVRLSDITLVSEIETIRSLGKEAIEFGKEQKVILMIDLGDLREGVWFEDALDFVEEVLKIDGVRLIGVGTNLTCYGGVIPDDKNLGKLVDLKKDIERKYNITIEVISGGNSSSLYKVLDGTISKEINMLRIGESIVLGRETAYGDKVEGAYEDAFILRAEIVELKEKPSIPIGEIGMDAFGNTPEYEDRGIIKRAIVAVGRQDVRVEGLTTQDEKIDILGASSDHMILDVSKSNKDYKLGDVIEFGVDYGALLSAMTSEYVSKYYK